MYLEKAFNFGGESVALIIQGEFMTFSDRKIHNHEINDERGMTVGVRDMPPFHGEPTRGHEG